MSGQTKRQNGHQMGRSHANVNRRQPPKPRKEPTPVEPTSTSAEPVCKVLAVLRTDERPGQNRKTEIRVVSWYGRPPTIEKRSFVRQRNSEWRPMKCRGFNTNDFRALLIFGHYIQGLLDENQQPTETILETHLSKLKDVAVHLRLGHKRVWAAFFCEQVDYLLAWARGETPQSESVESQFINVFNFCHLGLVLHRDELDE